MFMFLHRNAGTVSRSVGLLGVVGLLSYLLIACAANPGTPSPSAVIPGATHSPARHLDCSTSSTTSNKTLFVLSDTLVLSSATPSSNEAKLAFVLRAFDQSGNKLWEQSLGQGASGGSYAAVQAANGHVYVSLYDGPEKN